MTERQIKNIVFACDAGMGSSAMGVRHQSPDAIHVSVDNFMNSQRYDEVVELVRGQHQDGAQHEVLMPLWSRAARRPTPQPSPPASDRQEGQHHGT